TLSSCILVWTSFPPSFSPSVACHVKKRPKGPRGFRGRPGPPSNTYKVAFSVQLDNNLAQAGKPIVFPVEIYNDQKSYNTKTGYFTCEQPGVYEFSFFCAIHIFDAKVDLMRNNKRVLHSFTTRQSNFLTASGATILKLEKGDRVWLVAQHDGNSILKDSYFSGHFLFD
uniref:C1q domain-containing protein n=1 Tax=Stegastes partitus TaxID=144197 RepID=A0A3B5AF32_9TELE